MRTAKGSLLSILISFMMLAGSSFAGTWEDNFDDGKADGWTEVSGEWEVKDGTYQQTTLNPEYFKTIYEFGGWTDYTLEVDVTIVEGGPNSTSVCAGVLIRTDQTGSAGYRLWIRDDNSGFQFSVWMENTFAHVITDAAEKATPGQAYRLKVQIEGFTLSCWVDDRVMFEEHVDEDELFPAGQIGFISYNAHSQYDNLKIYGENVIAVAPAGKLAATWGSIKN